jgi:hypothetical protein
MFTARLTVMDATAMTTDSETVVITVSDPATTDPFDLRNTQISMTIEDGLRWLYVNQASRSSTPTTSWSLAGYTLPGTSLVALAFQNHSHLVGNDPTKDIYQPVVQRGLNYIFDQLSTQQLDLQMTGLNPAGNDPCVGPGIEPRPCTGLAANLGFSGYGTSIATFAVAAAAASAPTRTVAAGLGSQNSNFVEGKTYASATSPARRAASSTPSTKARTARQSAGRCSRCSTERLPVPSCRPSSRPSSRT